MNTLNTVNAVIFYILSIICIISAIFCLFQRETFKAVIGAMVLFFGISGFYFLLGAPYLGAVQILLWGVGIGILMLFSVMMTDKKEDTETGGKRAEKPDLKAIAAPVTGVLFAIILIPFILYSFKEVKIQTAHTIEDFAALLYKNNPFSFELTGILLFAVIVGVCAVIINKKNKIKSAVALKMPENKTEQGKGGRADA